MGPLDVSGPQQLAVRYSSALQTSGGNLTLGAREIGSTGYSEQTAYISNTGLSALGNISFSITGPNAADFSLATVPATPPASLGVNEFITLNPRFAPQGGSAGNRTATLTIQSNDPASPAFTINLKSTANPAPSFSNWTALATLPSDQQGTTDDPDGDSLPNLIEFVLNSQPGTAGSASFPQSFIEEGGISYPSFTFTRRNPLSGVGLNIEISFDLTFSQLVPAVIVSTTDHGNGTATVTVRSSQAVSSSDYQFFRLSATLTQ